MISATSPNQEGVAGTDSEEVWMITEESAILFISTSLLGTNVFFLIKEAYFYARSLLVTSHCAIRGPYASIVGDPLAVALELFSLQQGPIEKNSYHSHTFLAQ